MYRSHGFQDKDLLLETLVKDNTMTFFPEFNLLAVTSSPEPFHESMSRETAIFNVMASEISSGKFFEGFEYVSELVFDDGRDRAFAVFDSFEQDSDDAGWKDPRLLMLANLFSWSPTIDTGSISGMVDAVTYYQNHLLSDREGFEQSHGKPAFEVHVGKSHSDAKELLDKLTSSETVSYFPEFNLLVTTTDYVPSGLRDRETAVFNVFPSELAYGKLFYGFENVADIPYSGPVIDPIAGWGTFTDHGDGDRTVDRDLGSLAMLLSGSDVISTQSVPELLDTMMDRFGIEPAERDSNAERAQTVEDVRTGKTPIEVNIDCHNDDNFITGTVTVDGQSCYFYRANTARDLEDYDPVVLEPFRPDGYEGEIEEVDLPVAIAENQGIVEVAVVEMTQPYMDPDKGLEADRSLDSLCEEKTDEAQSMRYGMEGVGLPMLDAAEHLANY